MSRPLSHCPGRSTESIRLLADAGGWTMPSVRPCSLWPECSPAAADLGGILSVCATRPGFIWWPCSFCRTTPDPEVVSGAAAAVPGGIGFGVAAWSGPEREQTGTPREPSHGELPAPGAIHDDATSLNRDQWRTAWSLGQRSSSGRAGSNASESGVEECRCPGDDWIPSDKY